MHYKILHIIPNTLNVSRTNHLQRQKVDNYLELERLPLADGTLRGPPFFNKKGWQ